ncbi:MAG TPA: glycosyltransferase, partial [Sphingomonas sp.]|nr:glycosyltransferase [Sphingomonas sp.]
DLPEREEWNGLKVHRPRFPILPGLGAANPALLAKAILPLLRAIRARFAFDAIDAEFFFPDGPAAVRLGRALGVPVSIKARGADIHQWGGAPFCRGQILRAGREAGRLLAVSEALKRDMTALGLPDERIRVHYTGVDLARFRPAPDRAAVKAALGVAGPLFLSVGALIPRKRHHLAIEALALLPEGALWIAGEGPERARLEALIARQGLGERVRLLGGRSPDELAVIGAAADVGVLASSSEGLANAWVESLACGAPVVAADIGGARELIDRPEAGRIVAAEPAAIAAAMAELARAPPEPAAVWAAAARFTWEANAAALREHLLSLSRSGERGMSKAPLTAPSPNPLP